MKKAVIFGTTDFAQVASVYLSQDSPYTVEAFTVHEKYIKERTMMGLPVVAFEEIQDHFPTSEYEIFVAIGFSKVNDRRTEIYRLCKGLGYTMLTYISSKAINWGHLQVGDNCFIFESNVLQPFAKIGNNCILWSGNHVGHHSVIGDNCFIASHVVISGRVEIGDDCFIGVNATLRDGIKVAPGCVVGAGSLVLKDTIEKGVYKGTNTSPLEYRSDQLRAF